MRQLLLMRHAKSSWDQRELPDRERPLSVRGRAAAAAMRDAMAQLGLAPDLVLVSPARRTLQTMEAFEPWDDTPLVDRLDELYDAPCGTLLDTLRGVKETVRSVMLIAHNPGLHELALTLAGDPDKLLPDTSLRRLRDGYPSGALAEFIIPGPWQQLDAGRGRLVRFLCPRDLPSMAGAED